MLCMLKLKQIHRIRENVQVSHDENYIHFRLFTYLRLHFLHSFFNPMMRSQSISRYTYTVCSCCIKPFKWNNNMTVKSELSSSSRHPLWSHQGRCGSNLRMVTGFPQALSSFLSRALLQNYLHNINTMYKFSGRAILLDHKASQFNCKTWLKFKSLLQQDYWAIHVQDSGHLACYVAKVIRGRPGLRGHLWLTIFLGII